MDSRHRNVLDCEDNNKTYQYMRNAQDFSNFLNLLEKKSKNIVYTELMQ